MDAKIIYYFSPDSRHCRRMKDYLDRRGLVVEAVDVSANDQAKQNLLTQSGQAGVPCLVLFNNQEQTKVIIGFVPSVLDQELPI